MPDLEHEKLEGVRKNFEVLRGVIEASKTTKEVFREKILAWIDFLLNKIKRLIILHSSYSIDEEEKEITEFEIVRLKQEMQLRGLDASNREEQRLNAYRRRVQQTVEDTKEEEDMKVDQPDPNELPQPELQPRDNSDSLSEGEESHSDDDMNVDPPTPTFTGGGVRLGGEANEEVKEDPKVARMKWLEKMGKK